MKLSIDTLNDFEKKGYIVPKCAIKDVKKYTQENPLWIHFGAGNIFRAFPAQKMQYLLDEGLEESGICVVETFDEEIIDKAFTPFENLTVNVSLKSDGTVAKSIVGSIVESFGYSSSKEQVVSLFQKPSLQIVSLTITEKGYSTVDDKGEILPYIKSDIENFDNPKGVIGILAKLLYMRFLSENNKVAIVSLDNCAHNGTLLKNALMLFASTWEKAGNVTKEFVQYLEDEKNISFTWSMIDKITPRPSEEIEALLKDDGFFDGKITKTEKNTFVSAFVNAEECEYLAIEDRFPNGRPALEKTGIMFADRETIDKIEKMKVCTCLNPLHTALAIFGCLLEYDSISKEMQDPLLKLLVEKIGHVEGMPVVVNPGIMSAKDFIDECINKRFPNPYVPDTPQRIACDTSKKIPVRFGETLKAYIASGKNDLSFLKYIPLVFAGWARYLMGKTDALNAFELSPDPNLEKYIPYVKDIKIGEKNDLSRVKELFSSKEVFGIDLYNHGLGTICEEYFEQMIEGKGAVRVTLESVINK